MNEKTGTVYTPEQIAEQWGVARHTVLRIFTNRQAGRALRSGGFGAPGTRPERLYQRGHARAQTATMVVD